jgi:sugar phosphate isomerase/epimerase
MTIVLGVDTLTYHCRLEAGEISVEQVLEESAELGFGYVQLNVVHLRDRSMAQLGGLRATADGLGLALHLAGEQVGYAHQGEPVSNGVERIEAWTASAAVLGSPIVRVSSGFYRHDLPDPAAIAAEHRYVIDTLAAGADRIAGSDVKLVLENHSDFTLDEYAQVIETVGADRVGVFLDIINPISTLNDPVPVIRRLLPWAPAGHVKDYRFESMYVEGNYHRRGFQVQWCYPGEGVAPLGELLSELARGQISDPYYLSIEGLDSRRGVADQRERLSASLTVLRRLLPAQALSRS